MILTITTGNEVLRFILTTTEPLAEQSSGERLLKHIPNIISAIASNYLGDAGDLNEWLIPFMKRFEIQAINIQFDEDCKHPNGITFTREDMSQLGDLPGLNVLYTNTTAADELFELIYPRDQTTLIIFNRQVPGTVLELLARNFPLGSKVYFISLVTEIAEVTAQRTQLFS